MAGRFALIIASDDYADAGLRRLAAPTHDAEELSAVLSDPGIGGFDVDLVINRPSHDVRRRIEMFFTDRHPDDLLLLYFSGHGLKDLHGRLFLAMTDTEQRLLQATAVPAGFVQDAMNGTRCRRSVLLLDCCYGGAFARGMREKSDGAIHVADGFGASGSVVLTASDAVQYSFEEGTVTGRPAESVFTRALVDGLRTGSADRGQDGDVDLDELYDFVHDRVVEQQQEQRPGKWSWDIYGKILVAHNPRWRLPDRLRWELQAIDPDIRLEAAEHLVRLARSNNPRVGAACRQALNGVVGDPDPRVARAARMAGAGPDGDEATQYLARPSEAEPAPPTAHGQPPAGPGSPQDGPGQPPAGDDEPPAGHHEPPTGSGQAQDEPDQPQDEPDQPQDEPDRRPEGPAEDAPAAAAGPRRLWRLIGAVAALVVAITVGLAAWLPPAATAVPAVGDDPAAAAATLRADGFTVASVRVTNDTVPAGAVVRIDPRPGTRVHEHSTVTVFVSTGRAVVSTPTPSPTPTPTRPPTPTRTPTGTPTASATSTHPPATVTVPDVAGLSASTAETRLRSAGLVPARRRIYSDAVADGLVVRTSPPAGSSVQPGTTVRLSVSLGPSPTTPPPESPDCAVDPPSGPPGAALTVRCTGFTAGANAIVQWQGNLLSSEIVDGSGSVVLPVNIPTGFLGSSLPGRTFDLEVLDDSASTTVRYTVTG